MFTYLPGSERAVAQLLGHDIMAVRNTMSDLIARVRSLIADPTAQQFQDQDVQDALDFYRVNVRAAILRPSWTLSPGGVASYTDYYADTGDWESDAVIQNGAFATIAPGVSDWLTGHWSFTLPAPGQLPPLFITGKYYDRYAASADLLERWAAVLAGNYDFAANGSSFRRSQPFQAKLTLAQQYRQKALVHSIPMTRSDLSDDTSMASIAVGNTDVMSW